jgi:hypothetical protein
VDDDVFSFKGTIEKFVYYEEKTLNTFWKILLAAEIPGIVTLLNWPAPITNEGAANTNSMVFSKHRDPLKKLNEN